MVSQIDIYRTAQLWIEQQGVLAEDQAKMRMNTLLLDGDDAGYHTWKQILEAILVLREFETTEELPRA